MKPNLSRCLRTPTTTARILCCLALFAAGLFLAGCGKTGKTVARIDPTGLYRLVTVDGLKLPATISHDGAKLEIRSGTFTINADGTCSSKMVFVPPTGREATREVKAVYTQEGAKLDMRWEGAGQTIGTVTGDTFTMNNEGMVLAYRR